MTDVKRAIKDLGLALLNATLLLAVIFSVLVLLILNRAADVISDFEQISRVPGEVIATLENDPLLDGLDRLRENLASVNASFETEGGEEISREIALLRQQLSSLSETLEDAASQCVLDIEQVVRATLASLTRGGVSSPVETVLPGPAQAD